MKYYRYSKISRPLFFFAGTIVMMVVMAITGAPLKTQVTPKGILDLEFAYNSAKAASVVNAWTGTKPVDKIQTAKNNTWFDFIFIFFYSLFLYHGCMLLASAFSGPILIIGRFLAYGALCAGLLDVLENIGMLVTLQGHISEGCSLLTVIFSITKWLMVLAAVAYFVIAGLSVLYKKIKAAEKLD